MKKFNQHEITRIIFSKLLENEAVAPPIPELGVMQGDTEPTESAYDWVFRNLPKPAREAIQDWHEFYERQRQEWWKMFQEEWHKKHGEGSPFGDKMRKEFNDLWEKMKEQFVHIKTTDPRGNGLPGNIDEEMNDIFYKHFGFDLYDDEDDGGVGPFTVG